MAHTPWSFTPYSLPQETTDVIWDSVFFLETVNAQIGLGHNENDAVEFRERVLAVVSASSGIVGTMNAQEDVLCAARIIVGISETMTATETVSAKVALAHDMYDGMDAHEDVTAQVALGLNAVDAFYAQEAVKARVALGLTLNEKMNAVEYVNCVISAHATAIDALILSVSIPPGATLVLNSDNYTAKLISANGAEENVLHLVDGEWIYLDRRAVELAVNTGTGDALISTVTYRERWL